jgi:ATP-dependent Clp protease ATP-binding subunit ClpA
VFERLTEPARLVVIYAQEEARGLGHQHIGAEHLLLGVVRAEDAILPAGVDDIRARTGRGPGGPSGQIRFTAGAKGTLERGLHEALTLGHDHIAPAHLLLALADLGNPRVDARLLLAMLAKDGRAAALLRDHGLDEAAVRDRLSP